MHIKIFIVFLDSEDNLAICSTSWINISKLYGQNRLVARVYHIIKRAKLFLSALIPFMYFHGLINIIDNDKINVIKIKMHIINDHKENGFNN